MSTEQQIMALAFVAGGAFALAVTLTVFHIREARRVKRFMEVDLDWSQAIERQIMDLACKVYEGSPDGIAWRLARMAHDAMTGHEREEEPCDCPSCKAKAEAEEQSGPRPTNKVGEGQLLVDKEPFSTKN